MSETDTNDCSQMTPGQLARATDQPSEKIPYTNRVYPCGCKAQGPGDVPDYCPEHVHQPALNSIAAEVFLGSGLQQTGLQHRPQGTATPPDGYVPMIIGGLPKSRETAKPTDPRADLEAALRFLGWCQLNAKSTKLAEEWLIAEAKKLAT